MPLFSKITLDGCQGGIWKITETWEELCSMLPRSGYHHNHVCHCFQSEKRRLEYTAVRVLLYVLTGEDRDVTYLPSGRPCLDGVCSLSISHTSGYAAVLLTGSGRAGVDIEAYTSRVLRLKPRIVGLSEKADTVYEILLHWSAKETAFKLLDEEGIDFTRHLHVENLCCMADDENPDTCGTFLLRYRSDESAPVCFILNYLTTCDFVLTYAHYDKEIHT